MRVYPRESVEFHPTVLKDGDTVVAPSHVAISGWRERPSTWIAPLTIDDKHGVMVSGREPGYYRTWARVTDTPETPVVECEPFTVT